MRKLRILALMHEDLVPPDSTEGLSEQEIQDWKTEFDVTATLDEMGHEVLKLGVRSDLGVINQALDHFRPTITFNLLEEFHGVTVYDQYVAAYLELMKQPYTGCNPRGLMLARDKALAKQILLYHRIPTPRFVVYPKGRAVKPPKRLDYPLFVKSTVEDASLGLSRDCFARDPDQVVAAVEHCHREIGTDALVEEFIEGREFYVGALGNQRIELLPIWELIFSRLPEGEPNIATAKVKWDYEYQSKVGVQTRPARELAEVQRKSIEKLCKRIYRALCISGYARIDLRMRPDGRVFVLEANPNPNLSYGEDFAESAHKAGMKYERLLERIIGLGLRYRPLWHG
jgi:D-alanine-D-alanine ligase